MNKKRLLIILTIISLVVGLIGVALYSNGVIIENFYIPFVIPLTMMLIIDLVIFIRYRIQYRKDNPKITKFDKEWETINEINAKCELPPITKKSIKKTRKQMRLEKKLRKQGRL